MNELTKKPDTTSTQPSSSPLDSAVARIPNGPTLELAPSLPHLVRRRQRDVDKPPRATWEEIRRWSATDP